jgi:hypothetical protein
MIAYGFLNSYLNLQHPCGNPPDGVTLTPTPDCRPFPREAPPPRPSPTGEEVGRKYSNPEKSFAYRRRSQTRPEITKTRSLPSPPTTSPLPPPWGRAGVGVTLFLPKHPGPNLLFPCVLNPQPVRIPESVQVHGPARGLRDWIISNLHKNIRSFFRELFRKS